MELPEHLLFDQPAAGLPETISLPAAALDRVARNRAYLDEKLKQGKVHYGINTGFGSLCNVVVSPEDLSLLQENLVCSHACGFGAMVPVEIVRWMLFLKIKGLCGGFSGVRPLIVERLAAFYNKGIIPVVFEQGSLGASGDLAPLAHLSLPLLGKGKVHYKGNIVDAAEALQAEGIEPIALAAKEGLALLNGTQFMSAYGSWALLAAKRLSAWADAIGALSGEGYMMKADPFHPRIQALRPHQGQIDTAANIRSYLEGSALQQQAKEQVQDPYSFRCMPQVHGATKDTLRFFESVVTTEVNAVTDNPLVIHDEDVIVSGGNFHGQPMALQLDFLAIAMAELANISERRTYLLISGQRGLPPFLAPHAGLNSGFMIAQYTAASIVSQNKQYCTPASVDSIVSSNGQEDHVSMGANAATKLYRVLQNVQRVLAIELLTAAQAMDFRRPAKTSAVLEQVYAAIRKEVSFMDKDRVLHEDMIRAEALLNRGIDQIKNS
ncbi:MAG: histidine ammonia-lyase [Chitinophagaceae bacterium]|nr:histidine ammonia-lyase [Chitinophagaceae bacterium]